MERWYDFWYWTVQEKSIYVGFVKPFSRVGTNFGSRGLNNGWTRLVIDERYSDVQFREFYDKAQNNLSGVGHI